MYISIPSNTTITPSSPAKSRMSEIDGSEYPLCILPIYFSDSLKEPSDHKAYSDQFSRQYC